MKKLIFVFFLIISVNLPAQPGDIVGYSLRRFDELTKQLKQDPDNYDLIWERLNLPLPLYRKHFDIYTKSGTMIRESIIFPQENHKKLTSCTINANDILADINKLIDSKIEIKEKLRPNIIEADTTDFILMRGQLYYLLGETEKALSDYFLVLELTDDYNVEREIYISLAAYYYNLEIEIENGQIDNSNKREALKYIDMISSVEFSEFAVRDSYEHIKISLLKYLKEYSRLENYYKKFIQNNYAEFEVNEMAERNNENGYYSYSTADSYIRTLSYVNDLANYYYDRKNYFKAKWLGEQAIKFHPKNDSEHIPNSLYVSAHYQLLNKIYQLDEFKNYDKEMNCLIGLVGDPRLEKGYKTQDIGKYIKDSLQKYPREPRLYLALAIWHYKNRSIRYGADANEILDLLEKAQQLKFVDYRIPYIKALVYLYSKKDYELGLIEIDKALKLYQGNSSLYYTKCNLLRKLPNPDEEEIQKLDKEATMKWRINNFQSMSNFIEKIQE